MTEIDKGTITALVWSSTQVFFIIYFGSCFHAFWKYKKDTSTSSPHFALFLGYSEARFRVPWKTLCFETLIILCQVIFSSCSIYSYFYFDDNLYLILSCVSLSVLYIAIALFLAPPKLLTVDGITGRILYLPVTIPRWWWTREWYLFLAYGSPEEYIDKVGPLNSSTAQLPCRLLYSAPSKTKGAVNYYLAIYNQGYTRIPRPKDTWQTDIEEFNTFREAFVASLNDPEKKRRRDQYFSSHKPYTPLIRLYRRVMHWLDVKKVEHEEAKRLARLRRQERELLFEQQQQEKQKNDLEQRKRNAYLKQGITPMV